MNRLVLLAVVLTPAVASAHIALTYPPPRTQSQKVGPCGAAGSVRGTAVTVLAPGSMLEVKWAETINHPSHYRISFDQDGQDFTVPADFMDFSQTENVVADNIADGTGPFTRMIQLPDIECENCTLQLIQMMYDKPPYGDGNDIYFQCADIALRTGGAPPPDAGGGNPADPDAGVDDPGPGGGGDEISGGCAAGGGSSTQALWMLALLAPLARRVRRRA